MIRIGIIGAGKIAQNALLSGFSERGCKLSKSDMDWYDFGGCDNGKVFAICDKNIDAIEQLAEKYDIPNIYEDWHEIINNRDIDAVCVATPNYLHHEMTVAAANAGKHVLVEKPIACNLEEADNMIQAASQNNVILMMQQTFRFMPSVDIAHRIINSGILGKMISVKGIFCTPGPDMWAPGSDWFFSPQQAGYGALLDVGIHAIDLVHYLSGKKVRKIAAFGGTYIKDITLDDNAVCIFKFEDDSLGMVEASWTGKLDVSVEIKTEKGRLRINIGHVNPVQIDFITKGFSDGSDTQSGSGRIAGFPGEFIKGSFFPKIPSVTRFQGPFQYFINCIINNKKPFISGEEGRADLEVILAGYKSMKEKRVVLLHEDSSLAK